MSNALGPDYTKGTRSNNNGACVELRMNGGNVEMRDSKDPHGPSLKFSPKEYAALVESIMDGELRLP